MILTTLPEVPGHRIVKVLGVVKGSTVRQSTSAKTFWLG
jgi:uncharacterized protein YbjQ (UPF0145 family)